MVFFVIFTVQNDGPASWKGGVVDVEIVGFKEEAAEDGLDGQGLAVWEVDYRLRHRGCVAFFRLSMLLFLCHFNAGTSFQMPPAQVECVGGLIGAFLARLG